MAEEMHTGTHEPEPVVREDTEDAVVVEVPAVSGHQPTGRRAERARTALKDERVERARHVTVSLPRGDHEALTATREELDPDEVHPAGSTVIVHKAREADG